MGGRSDTGEDISDSIDQLMDHIVHERMPDIPPGKSFRLGQGDTVSPEYQATRGRSLFGTALYRRAPRVTRDLLQTRAFELQLTVEHAVYEVYRERTGKSPYTDQDNRRNEALYELVLRACRVNDSTKLSGLFDGPKWKFVSHHRRHLDAYVDGWQDRFHLTDPWLHGAALSTIHMVSWLNRNSIIGAARDTGAIEWSAWPDNWPIRQCPLLLSHEDILVRLREELSGCQSNERAMSVESLLDRLRQAVQAAGASATIGWFDPNSETTGDATKRFSSALKPFLQSVLEAKAEEARALRDAVPPRTYRSMQPFDWLVRYQVLEQSRSSIAAAEGIDRPHVARTINDTAEVIGLTLRTETGGRPAKSRSNTKRVR